jgi:hypothetical protein
VSSPRRLAREILYSCECIAMSCERRECPCAVCGALQPVAFLGASAILLWLVLVRSHACTYVC